MASLSQPSPYGSSYYPSAGSVRHTGRPAPDEGGGSFGPVLVVLAVVSFLSAAACIAGRLCGRRSSSSMGKSSAWQEQSAADAEKGLGAAKHPAVMRPLPSSRATVHDMDDDDDVFEIKFAQMKPPAGWEKHGAGGGGGGRMPALPQPLLGPPRQYAAAGFRCAPGNGAGVARQAHPPQVRGAGDSCTAPARPTK
ncbi:hypothetical protein ACQJBY_064014 [Aegilops geniculata]